MTEILDAAKVISESINGPNFYNIGTSIASTILSIFTSIFAVILAANRTINLHNKNLKQKIVKSLLAELSQICYILSSIIENNPGKSEVHVEFLINADAALAYKSAINNIGILDERILTDLVENYTQIITIKHMCKKVNGNFYLSMEKARNILDDLSKLSQTLKDL